VQTVHARVVLFCLTAFGNELASACVPAISPTPAQAQIRAQETYQRAAFVVDAQVVKAAQMHANVEHPYVTAATWRVTKVWKGSVAVGATFRTQGGYSECPSVPGLGDTGLFYLEKLGSWTASADWLYIAQAQEAATHRLLLTKLLPTPKANNGR
jgi:hypothetical protein